MRRPDSSRSSPAMNRMKNGSTPSVSAGRAMIRPTLCARDPDRDLAAALGRQPISLAMSRMSLRVSADTPGRPLSAYDTAPIETPALAAISAMVGRFTASPLTS
nr:hypothetical protein [Microbispora sitophila]